MPGNWCSVPFCRNNSNVKNKDGHKWTFFCFPKNPTLQREWLDKCKVKNKNSINVANARICSAHFTNDDYEDLIKSQILGTQPRKLKDSVVPSLNLSLQKKESKKTQQECVSLHIKREESEEITKQRKIFLEEIIKEEILTNTEQKPLIDTNQNTVDINCAVKNLEQKVTELTQVNLIPQQDIVDLMNQLRKKDSKNKKLEKKLYQSKKTIKHLELKIVENKMKGLLAPCLSLSDFTKMSAPPLMRSLSTRAVKKLEKPRPLKISSSQTKISNEISPRLPLQDLMLLVESVSQHLSEKQFDDTLNANVIQMHSKLKIHGPQLEIIFKDQLDRAFVIFRNGCHDAGLICTVRLCLLELVELRANQWNCDPALNYYSTKMGTEMEVITAPTLDGMSAPSPPLVPALGPGEVLKTSGKFAKPTKIAGKNYCKDEVVIRNSDSGKVMGIKGRRVHMIEELSETIISFQRVNPGAKERLVQITGPSDENLLHARQLMEDTIRRNASPIRDGFGQDFLGSNSSLNSTASEESNRQTGPKRSLLHSFSTNDARLGEYKYTITLGNDTVKITGTNHETVRNARLVLEEYYNAWLQKNCIGDCYGAEEDVIMDEIPDLNPMRLNSVDSGNGNGRSTSSGDSDDVTCISADPSPVASSDAGLSYTNMYASPQSEERPVLGRSNVTAQTSPQNQVVRKYSREFLLDCALSRYSNAIPPNWDQIVEEFPVIAKKDGSPFDSKAFAKRTISGSAQGSGDGE